MFDKSRLDRHLKRTNKILVIFWKNKKPLKVKYLMSHQRKISLQPKSKSKIENIEITIEIYLELIERSDNDAFATRIVLRSTSSSYFNHHRVIIFVLYFLFEILIYRISVAHRACPIQQIYTKIQKQIEKYKNKNKQCFFLTCRAELHKLACLCFNYINLERKKIKSLNFNFAPQMITVCAGKFTPLITSYISSRNYIISNEPCESCSRYEYAQCSSFE